MLPHVHVALLALFALVAAERPRAVVVPLVLPAGCAAPALSARLVAADGTEWTGRVEAGRLRWRDVPPGRYRLDAFARGRSTPIASRASVLVSSHAARVPALDLSGALLRAPIRVVDARSAPVAFADVFASCDGTPLARTDADGVATAWLPPGGVDVTIRARAHRIATRRGFVGGVVTLSPRLRVRASVVSDGATLPPETVLLLRFRSTASTTVAARNEVGVCRAVPGVAHARVQRAGPTEVTITLADARNARGGYVFTDHPFVSVCRVRIRPVDADAPQSVTIVVPRDRLEDAIRRLRAAAARWPGRHALAPERASCDNAR